MREWGFYFISSTRPVAWLGNTIFLFTLFILFGNLFSRLIRWLVQTINALLSITWYIFYIIYRCIHRSTVLKFFLFLDRIILFVLNLLLDIIPVRVGNTIFWFTRIFKTI